MLATIALAAALLHAHPAPSLQDAAEAPQETVAPLGELAEGCALAADTGFKSPDRLPLRVRWSSDGSLAAYIGFRGEGGAERVPVVQRAGEEPLVGDVYDFVDPPTIAADVPRVAFRVGNTVSKKQERWWVWLDGEPKCGEDWLGAVALSPDGARIAYWAQPGAKLEASGAYAQKPLVLRVHDASKKNRKAKRPRLWDDARALEAPVFTRDSERVFGLALEDGRWYAVGRGRKGFETIGEGTLSAADLQVAKGGKVLVFSALTQQLIAGVNQQGHHVVVAGEVVPTQHVRTGYGSPTPDGKRLAHAFMSFAGVMGVTIEDGKGKPPGFDHVGRAAWDPKGTRVAFASVTRSGGVDGEALTLKGAFEPRGGEWRLTQWTRRGKEHTSTDAFERVRDPVYAPKGDRVAVRALDEKGWRAVVFDLDGAVVARGPAHAEVGLPRFTADGAAVVYGVRDERALGWATLALP
ncbi:MAG: hypothetical protein AAFP22_01715 [Planctomycetota bacterium]